MFARFIRSVAVLLVAGQAIVAQAHVHGPQRTVGAVTHLAALSTPSPQPPDDPLACPVCREVAHAGAYIAPGPIALAAPPTVAYWLSAGVLPIRIVGRSSHAWQSRAPPIPLHA